MTIFVGVDWAEAHHDVCVKDDSGGTLAKRRVPDGIAGVRQFHELVAPFIEEPTEALVGIETDRGLFVGALVAAGYVLASRSSTQAPEQSKSETTAAP